MTRTRRRFRHHSILVNIKLRKRWRKRSAKRNREGVKSAKFQSFLRRKDTRTGLQFFRLYAPSRFSLVTFAERQEVLRFLDTLHRLVVDERRNVYLDFSRTKKMFADGTLLFYATISRLASVLKLNNSIRCTYPKDKIVAQVLSHLGFFKVFGREFHVTVDHKTVKYWRVADSTKVEGAKAAFLEDLVRGTIVSESLMTRLYKALTEAMSNCKHHAYPEHDESWVVSGIAPDRRWWMFLQVLDGTLAVSFCDLGIGIPNSMRSEVIWSQNILKAICRIIGRSYGADSSMILAALESGRSQTGEANRGKGLLEIRNVLEEHGRGQMNIYSGKAAYHYSPRKKIEKTNDYAEHLPGTLIFWNIPLGYKSSNDTHND